MARNALPASVRRGNSVVPGPNTCSTGYWYADLDPTDIAKLVAHRRKLLPPPRLGDLVLGHQPHGHGRRTTDGDAPSQRKELFTKVTPAGAVPSEL
jgi:hypothetical protein